MERFLPNLKIDRVWQKDYAHRNEAMVGVADYIAEFIYCVRLHSPLSNSLPNPLERKLATQLLLFFAR